MNLQKNIRRRPLFSWKERGDIAKMASILLSEGILVGYSDTIFGLLAIVSNTSKRGLDRIKRRENKPYIVLTDQEIILSKIDHEKYSALSVIQKLLWPGPLTVVTDLKGFDPCAYSQEGFIALRVPNHDGLLALIALVGPLFSTSANREGGPVPQHLNQLDKHISKAVDGFIIENKSDVQNEAPSTIIKLCPSGYKVIREGAVSVERLESLLL